MPGAARSGSVLSGRSCQGSAGSGGTLRTGSESTLSGRDRACNAGPARAPSGLLGCALGLGSVRNSEGEHKEAGRSIATATAVRLDRRSSNGKRRKRRKINCNCIDGHLGNGSARRDAHQGLRSSRSRCRLPPPLPLPLPLLFQRPQRSSASSAFAVRPGTDVRALDVSVSSASSACSAYSAFAVGPRTEPARTAVAHRPT